MQDFKPSGFFRRCTASLPIAFALGLGACALPGGDEPEVQPAQGRPLQLSAAEEVSSERMSQHVGYLAAAARDPGNPHLAEAREYCRAQLAELGYTILEQDFTNRTNPYVTGYPASSGRNIHGYINGDTKPGEMVMVSAHVDGVPGCAAANDNASGVAAVLEVARVLARGPHRRTTIASCWDAEETGSVGSWVYASEAKAAGWVKIKINFVFDMIGWYSSDTGSQKLPGGTQFANQFRIQADMLAANEYRADFIGLVGNGSLLGGTDGAARYAAPFQNAATALGLSSLAIFPNLGQALGMMDVLRSDHSSFWLNGYNALFITDTGEFRQQQGVNKYHCQEAPDTIEDIDFDTARKVAQATAQAMQWAADE